MEHTENREPNMDAVKRVYLDTIAALHRQAELATAVAEEAAKSAAQAKVWAETSADRRDQIQARLEDVVSTYKADFPNE